MGPLIGLDTTVFIYHLEGHPEFGPAASALLSQVESGEVRAVFSAIGMIELLTGPKRAGRADIVVQYRHIISNFPNLMIRGISERVVDLASDLRAAYNIRTPDAIHMATACLAGAERFVTNDRQLVVVKELPVEILQRQAC